MTERWMTVRGYGGMYEVSDLGNVASRKSGAWKLLIPAQQRNGYLHVGLVKNGARKFRLVHDLVLEAFIGGRPRGYDARHFPNSSRTDNRLENLSWATPAVNHSDKVVHGTHNKGDRHPNAKFTATDIERMFDLRRSGCTQLAIAKQFACSRSYVGGVLQKRFWSHI